MTKFTAAQFVPTEWDSAAEKAAFANWFVRFVEGGFKETVFYKKRYTRLSMMFGHIAHYNRAGFYSVWFETPDAQHLFLARVVGRTIYGDPAYTYSDVERVLQAWADKEYAA